MLSQLKFDLLAISEAAKCGTILLWGQVHGSNYDIVPNIVTKKFFDQSDQT